jgi:cell division protein FtsL
MIYLSIVAVAAIGAYGYIFYQYRVLADELRTQTALLLDQLNALRQYKEEIKALRQRIAEIDTKAKKWGWKL